MPNMVTVIPEGNHYELLGWAMPRLEQVFGFAGPIFHGSARRRFTTWIPIINGGERPFVVTGLYEQVPADGHLSRPTCSRRCLAGDIDKMENLGIYEVVEEDFALCEFVDPSKIEMQQIIRDGINLMIKEA